MGYFSEVICSFFGDHGLWAKFILLNLVAILIYYFFESPVQHFLRSLRIPKLKKLEPSVVLD
jgi:hypothetical protein